MLDWLPDRTRTQIEAATAAVEAALGDSLIAVCLIGAAARPDHRGGGNPELLIVSEALAHESLCKLGKGLVEPLRAGLQVRMVTRAELRGSVDVHALEIAQWRARHLRLAGRDPFAELDIAAADLRHELERALRTLGHRLRNRLLWCLATEQQRLDSLLRESLERLTVLARHSLRLCGHELVDDEAASLEAFLRWASAELEAITAITALRERLTADGAAGDPIAELAALTRATEAATEAVDSLAV